MWLTQLPASYLSLNSVLKSDLVFIQNSMWQRLSGRRDKPVRISPVEKIRSLAVQDLFSLYSYLPFFHRLLFFPVFFIYFQLQLCLPLLDNIFYTPRRAVAYTALCLSITLLSFLLLKQSILRRFIIFIVIHSLIEGSKRDGVEVEWRKLHNEELKDLYSSPNKVRVIKSRRMRWAGHVARMEEGRGVHKVLVGKPEGKRPLGRPRLRWEDNIKMDLQEVGRGCEDWMELAQDRDRWRALVSTVMNFRVP